MITWNELKQFDVTEFGRSKIDLTRWDVRTPKLPTFEFSHVGLPQFDRLTGLARDAAYAGFGATVVTVQKLDDQRRELTDQVNAQVRKLVATVA
jgi:hypothetical protein